MMRVPSLVLFPLTNRLTLCENPQSRALVLLVLVLTTPQHPSEVLKIFS